MAATPWLQAMLKAQIADLNETIAARDGTITELSEQLKMSAELINEIKRCVQRDMHRAVGL